MQMTQQRAPAQHQPIPHHPPEQHWRQACSVPGVQEPPIEHYPPLPGLALAFWGQHAPEFGEAFAPAVMQIPQLHSGVATDPTGWVCPLSGTAPRDAAASQVGSRGFAGAGLVPKALPGDGGAGPRAGAGEELGMP